MDGKATSQEESARHAAGAIAAAAPELAEAMEALPEEDEEADMLATQVRGLGCLLVGQRHPIPSSPVSTHSIPSNPIQSHPIQFNPIQSNRNQTNSFPLSTFPTSS